jgi:hypothetical protein
MEKNPNNNEIINLQILSFRGTNILMSEVYVSVTTAVALISLSICLVRPCDLAPT